MNSYDFYKSELSNYKKNSTKKSYLTRTIKSLESHLQDLLKHQKPSGNMRFGYLHGEEITPLRISKIKTEIQVCKNLKNQIK